jgi:nucleotide-binding universal stress UspA family protein
LLELAEEERADVIFLGTHHKRGFERLSSVASVALHFSHASVAVVPVSAEAAQSGGEVPLIRRVFVPTDFSPLSNAAAASAYALLTDRRGEIYLFHAAAPEGAARDPEIVAELRSLVPSRGVPETVTTRTEVVRQRDAARAIREAAERLGADAICMGSKGRTGLKRTVLGSVAESVLRESRCPVFVVRALPP